MAQFSNYYKIITPATRKQLYTTVAVDSYDTRAPTMAANSAVSWYSQVLKGAGSRQSSYKQYDAMDADIDIARSLDIIAEEMSGKDEKTNLPFTITYQKEDNEDISDTTAITLRQAVRQWSNTQDFNKRIFSIARCMIKYGDCFFRKTSDTKKWVYIDPTLVHGIEVDQLGNKVAYHIKRAATVNPSFGGKQEQFDVVPASAMIHFSMCDDMGEQAPFGTSVLRAVHRVYRQLSMIEDAVIIYRIVRAPERRVFYIDVGNQPPPRVKQYLEQIKNEIRQKRIPGRNNNGNDVVDGQFDATSMQEDIFFPVTAAGRGSRVETLPGGTEDFGAGLLKYFNEKISRGLRIPTSYMHGADGAGAQSNDGKVGIAYIEELRFAQFIRRLQDRLDEVLDQEFKVYLKVVGLKIDDEIFQIKLPDPANFALYRQAALDSDLIGSYNNIANDKSLSKRFVLKRYLGLTDDELQMNEVMIKEERNIQDTGKVSALQQIYDYAVVDNREAVIVDAPEESSSGGGDSSLDSDFADTEVDNGDGGGGSSFFSDGPAEEPASEEPPATETPPEEPAA